VTQLDAFAPVWQFREVHTIIVNATPARAYRAVEAVTAGEIRLFRALTWLRRFGRPGPASVLNPPGHLPILDVATRSGFLLLAAAPPTSPRDPLSASRRGGTSGEIVVGTVVIAPLDARRPRTAEEFQRPCGPGYAKAVMNFRIEDAGRGCCVVRTETRVHATDARTRRRFAAYWWVIYPGSALIRRMWLRAIRRRAEATLTP